jgi:hypothetical protein
VGGYDETNWVHVHAKNVAVVGAWVGLAAALYLGNQWLDNGPNGTALFYNGGNVTCVQGHPVAAGGCTYGSVPYTQAEWIERVTDDHNTRVIDGWTAIGLGLGGWVTLYSVNQADEARKRKAADAAASEAEE